MLLQLMVGAAASVCNVMIHALVMQHHKDPSHTG
jgi:hypothetical protein